MQKNTNNNESPGASGSADTAGAQAAGSQRSGFTRARDILILCGKNKIHRETPRPEVSWQRARVTTYFK